MALQAARRQVRVDEGACSSCTGRGVQREDLRDAPPSAAAKAMIVEVGGRAYQTGEARFRSTTVA